MEWEGGAGKVAERGREVSKVEVGGFGKEGINGEIDRGCREGERLVGEVVGEVGGEGKMGERVSGEVGWGEAAGGGKGDDSGGDAGEVQVAKEGEGDCVDGKWIEGKWTGRMKGASPLALTLEGRRETAWSCAGKEASLKTTCLDK